MSVMECLSTEKRSQILAGAAKVFAEEGYEGASMSRIAHEAAVSKGTLYNHFQNKADLFSVYVQDACSTSLSHVFSNVKEDGAPEEVLLSVADRMLTMMTDPACIVIYRVVMAEAAKFPHVAQTFYQAGPAEAIRRLTLWLTGAAADGRLTVEDPQFAAEQFLALVQTRTGLRRRLCLDHDVDPAFRDYVVRETVRMFLDRYAPHT
ncbi:TetR/AcrR family transcriptional regulator [Granulibacter bethesdensis]|uniref:Transcriptional regulator, TetR family n=1 Tax=Granulibacter bethesdensis (strain ATCC BAA-1260 / CGDNIH1) TaxID=391165 RepID=Q0BS47_GRABC|nr:TetR/AcrR family transcriptional regulator [Granulibacter bethesdensis]ABI62355.1 Transcriptional regulator, TetR family [Granulibacter bethesdensis CGDNIH1]AHJ68724.1 Transcriptional regulator, TetR family [Granulibacter bethesdensis]APH52185.1 Transcriptional regulator, TetR family [Granulibacter bethesdensis]APH64878.1 Transcriptional regulator, TetR family [Granulibacter bethesdensis]